VDPERACPVGTVRPPSRRAERDANDLAALLHDEPALYQLDYDPAGFRWIDPNDHDNSVVAFMRSGRAGHERVVLVFNFTPVPRHDYRLGVPSPGIYDELLNSDSSLFGGSNVGNAGRVASDPVAAHGFEHSVQMVLPPLGCILLKKR